MYEYERSADMMINTHRNAQLYVLSKGKHLFFIRTEISTEFQVLGTISWESMCETVHSYKQDIAWANIYLHKWV